MLKELLDQHQIKPGKVVEYSKFQTVELDLSKNNEALNKVDLNNEQEFTRFIFDQLPEGFIGIGGYKEERSFYRRSELFTEGEPRTIHLGVDLWAEAGTPVYAPIEAKIHSFDNRAFYGDYGPVIILEHKLGSKKLFSLYGHLSLNSLAGKEVGQTIKRGEQFAWLGDYSENFHWPPHLHFQLMWDMQGNEGDYPGVCRASEKEVYLANCPDPGIVLNP
ncbi:peptidoglycan DD-metalloendopeptidase family protein [Ekhidna sp.]|uniref:peptidoglycan DD-metalloendopeptidase family protein n=1 Tax=Ekhidna sp. TaxID=2608089 RepID=UPI003CCB8335